MALSTWVSFGQKASASARALAPAIHLRKDWSTVCRCFGERERERDIERDIERERDREREREREGERAR